MDVLFSMWAVQVLEFTSGELTLHLSRVGATDME